MRCWELCIRDIEREQEREREVIMLDGHAQMGMRLVCFFAKRVSIAQCFVYSQGRVFEVLAWSNSNLRVCFVFSCLLVWSALVYVFIFLALLHFGIWFVFLAEFARDVVFDSPISHRHGELVMWSLLQFYFFGEHRICFYVCFGGVMILWLVSCTERPWVVWGVVFGSVLLVAAWPAMRPLKIISAHNYCGTW